VSPHANADADADADADAGASAGVFGESGAGTFQIL